MKNKVLLYVVLVLCLTTGLGNTVLKAQDWSPAQKDVWKNVNDYWTLMAKGDINGFMEYFHTDYQGWENGSALPSSKEETRKYMEVMTVGSKTLVWDIKPLTIKIYGDCAFVHYYYEMVTESDGKKKPTHGHWTDILVKQGTKWVLIGDHGGPDPN